MYKSFVFLAFSIVMSAAAIIGERGFEKLPLVFEPNQGQTNSDVRFLAQGHGYTLYLTDREAVLSLRGVAPVRMSLSGGAKPAQIERFEPTGGVSNYLIGNDPAKWRTKIPHYKRVKYTSVYPGVDLVYYGDEGKLEYDLLIAPGADPSQIEIAYRGVESLRVDEKGDLLLKTLAGELRQQRPKVYQQGSGKRIEVAARYRLHGLKNVSFELAPYDRSKPLVIDPVLTYSTYLGGSNIDYANAIAVDPGGNVYITGITYSTNFPTANPLQSTGDAADGNAFVTKINASGSALVYSTYLGGSAYDSGNGIAVDSNGNAYVTGYTTSVDFPTTLPLQSSIGGGYDAFVTKLNASGSAEVYSTYLGGSGADRGTGIAVDGSGNAYVTGFTTSTNFPTANPFQSTNGGGTNAFVTMINASGSAKVYSTYLGGSVNDIGNAIAVDGSGNAYVTGYTTSANFPTVNPFQASNGGEFDAFVTKINPSGSAKVYSSYLGGSGIEQGQGIAVDSSGNAYVTGYTVSIDFPTTNPLQGSKGGNKDAFVTMINASGSAKIYSTYLGGSGDDIGTAIAVDSLGNAHVTGYTFSTDFPLANPLQASNGGGADVFVTKINAGGSAKIYSTYLGGSTNDQGSGIALGGSGTAYVAGATTSSNFPTANPLQAASGGGGGDAFVVSIFDPTVEPISVNPASGSGLTQTFTFTFNDIAGYSNLYVVDVLISTFLDGQTACYFAVAPTSATSGYLYLVDDAGDGGYVSGTPMALPSSGTLQNSQCAISGIGSSISGSGNTLTVTMAITFSSGFAGNKAVYTAARSSTQNSGWQGLGTWNVPGVAPIGPAVGGMSPARSSSMGQTYTFTFTDTNGYADLFVLDVLNSSFLDGIAACYFAYVPTSATNGYLYLVDDAGDGGYVSGSPMLLSSGGTLQNSQCTLNTVGSSASASGNTLALNLNIAYSASFAGNQVFFLAARNHTTGNSGWQAVGSVTVP